jgi:hypothetical protein
MAAETARGHTGSARQSQFDLVDRLARKSGPEAFEQAYARACALGNHTIAHVRNLLKAERQSVPIRAVAKPVRRTNSKNVRGAAYYGGKK